MLLYLRGNFNLIKFTMNQNSQPLIKGAVFIVIIAGILGTICVFTERIGLDTGKLFIIFISFIFFGIITTISMLTTYKPENKNLGTASMLVSVFAFLSS